MQHVTNINGRIASNKWSAGVKLLFIGLAAMIAAITFSEIGYHDLALACFTVEVIAFPVGAFKLYRWHNGIHESM